MNIGNFNRLSYDNCAYEDRIQKSTDPLNYRLSVDQIYNSDRCNSIYGPRNSTYGCSTIGSPGYAVSQNMVDVESVLTNRNVKASKSRSSDRVNPINPTIMKGTHAQICGNKLNPEYTRLSFSSKNYKGMSVNRFYDTIHDPQANIFYDFARNTTLESKDNFIPQISQPWNQSAALPVVAETGYKTCKMNCSSDTSCPTNWKTKF
jgi:hypothetical protein